MNSDRDIKTFRDYPPEDSRPRVLVCGPKSFRNWGLLLKKLDAILGELDHPIIVHGGQHNTEWIGKRWAETGVDYYAEQWAGRRLHLIKIFRMNKKDPEGGPKRDLEMVEYVAGRDPGFAVIFLDGKAQRPQQVLKLCKKHKLEIRTVEYDECES